MRTTSPVIVLAAVLALAGGAAFWVVVGRDLATSPNQSPTVRDEAGSMLRLPHGASEPARAADDGEPSADEPERLPVERAIVPILIYHHVSPDVSGPPGSRPYEVTPDEFAAQMDWLAANDYRTVTIETLDAAFDGRAELPERPVILTLDDGRANQYRHALPILRRHDFTATFYVFTNAIDRPGYLTSAQILEMAALGMTFGSHGRYHPYMTRIGDEELEEELVSSKRALEDILDTAITALSYPFGLVDDRVVAAAEALGYRTGRTLRHDVVQRADERMLLNAYIMTGDIGHLRRVMSAAESATTD